MAIRKGMWTHGRETVKYGQRTVRTPRRFMSSNPLHGSVYTKSAGKRKKGVHLVHHVHFLRKLSERHTIRRYTSGARRRGGHLSLATRAKISASLRRYYAGHPRGGHVTTEATRAAISAGLRKYYAANPQAASRRKRPKHYTKK